MAHWYKHLKPSLILSLVAGVLLLPLTGWCTKWMEFASEQAGRWERIYYIDGDSIKLERHDKAGDEQNLFRYWYREEYLDPARPIDQAFLMEADCGKRRYRILKSQNLPDGAPAPWHEEVWYIVTNAQLSGELRAYAHVCGMQGQ